MAIATNCSLDIQIIKNLADQMRDSNWVIETATHPSNNNPKSFQNIPLWGGVSLAGGYSSILLLFSQLDNLFPNEKWGDAAHEYVLKIKNDLEEHGVNSIPVSLYGGLAGVCFSIYHASKENTRYYRLIDQLNDYLIEAINTHYLIPLQYNLRQGRPSEIPAYDLIQGIVGQGVYAISNLSSEKLNSFAKEIIRTLIDLTKPIRVESTWVPGWYAPSYFQLTKEEELEFPKGNFNLGLAHGVTGILAFLSIAALRGIEVEGQIEAIETVTNWLKTHRKEFNGTYFWPAKISYADEFQKNGNSESKFSGRDAWCYGTPGIARSLYLAGKVLKNDSLQTYALDSFRSVFFRDREDWYLPGPTCCHGIAGLLLITSFMEKDTSVKDLKERKSELKNTLLQYYSSSHPFGFKDYDPTTDGKNVEIDRPGFLEGSVGILLTLLSLTNRTNWWDAPFLISAGN